MTARPHTHAHYSPPASDAWAARHLAEVHDLRGPDYAGLTPREAHRRQHPGHLDRADLAGNPLAGLIAAFDREAARPRGQDA